MNSQKQYMQLSAVKPEEIMFSFGSDRHGKCSISMHLGATAADIAFVTPACITHWPRVTGDGNFGTMWGPTDISKAKFSLDLCDQSINNEQNVGFQKLHEVLEAIDDKLLDFVYENQLKILGRKNLSREECKMLQIRTIRAKYDKCSGMLSGHSVQLTAAKFSWDGMGGKLEKKINVCDHTGNVIRGGTVSPGDVVAATMYASMVYTGVGGDKFGISWSFEDVSVICQRANLDSKSNVPAFTVHSYPYACSYETPQFSDPIMT